MNYTNQNFSDNPSKRGARTSLVGIVDKHFKPVSDKLTMLELLGTGVGTNFYLDNINNLQQIDCVELEKENFLSYKKTDNRVSLYHDDICNFIKSKNAKTYDIINLDLCAFYCEEKMITRFSSGDIIKKVLASRKFKVNSLIFVTFCLFGHTVDRSMYKSFVLTDAEEIRSRIKTIAGEIGIQLLPLSETMIYKSARKGWTHMMHTGFIIDAM